MEGKEREKERERIFYLVVRMARAGPRQNQELRASLGSLTCILGIHLGHLPLLSLVYWQGAGYEVEWLGLDPIHIWTAGTTDGSSVLHAMVLALGVTMIKLPE